MRRENQWVQGLLASAVHGGEESGAGGRSLVADAPSFLTSSYLLPVLLTIFQKVCHALAFAHGKGVLESVRDIKNQTSIERRHYLSSLELDVEEFARAVRSQWGVENRLHGVLNLLKADTRKAKRSITGRIRAAGWDYDCLLHGARSESKFRCMNPARGRLTSWRRGANLRELCLLLRERPTCMSARWSRALSRMSAGRYCLPGNRPFSSE